MYAALLRFAAGTDTPRDFVLLFEPPSDPLLALDAQRQPHPLKLVFLPPYRGLNRQARIHRRLLPPEAIIIKRGEAVIPIAELPVLLEAITNQYRDTQQGRTRHRTPSNTADKSTPNRTFSHLGEFALRKPILNDEFFKAPLSSVQCWVEMGLAERQGTDAQWALVCERADAWLRQHPDDLLLRATALWLALIRGDFGQMAAAVRRTAEWVLEGERTGGGPVHVGQPHAPDESPDLLDRMLPWLEPHGPLSAWHFEDNLVRAALLRWLRTQDKSSPTGQLAVRIKRVMETKGGPGMAAVVAPLLDEPHVARALAKAASLTLSWLPRNPRSSLLRVACVWTIGRRGQVGQVNEMIERIGTWLKDNPHEMLVRAAWMWMTGFHGGREQCERVIEDVGEWFGQSGQRDERMARSSWLWLVGHRGTAGQADAAIQGTADWLEAHPDDGFIRVAHLLFLVKRRGNREQIDAAVNQTRTWLRSHPAAGEVDLALSYLARTTKGQSAKSKAADAGDHE
ncbi:MAG: hypothetical protein KGS61_09250 [Verrucomicrobia bacterium]|nr:hypothetical protein [Verrucomicrobiota bacterium]